MATEGDDQIELDEQKTWEGIPLPHEYTIFDFHRLILPIPFSRCYGDRSRFQARRRLACSCAPMLPARAMNKAALRPAIPPLTMTVSTSSESRRPDNSLCSFLHLQML